MKHISGVFSFFATFAVIFFVLPAFSSAHASSPFNFNGSAGSNPGTVNLYWQDPTNLANSYSISYGYTTNASRFGALNIAEGAGGNTSFTVGALTPGMTYYFILNGYLNGAFVASSGPIAVTATSGTVVTPSAAPVSVPAAAPASAVSTANPWATNPTFGVQATTGQQSGTVTVNWADIYNVANNFALMYGTQPGQNTWGVLNIAEGAAGRTSFTVGGLTPGVRYYFTLVSWNSGTFIKYSNPVSAIAR